MWHSINDRHDTDSIVDRFTESLQTLVNTAALLASNHRLFVQMIPCREELLRQSHCDSCTLSFLDDGHKPRWEI